MNHEFEIEPGIVISKLDIKDGDTLIITIDTDMYDIDAASQMCKIVSDLFPNNNILTTFKGIEINKSKEKEVAGAGSSPK